ncbi:MAG: outer-membrane immunogenic protein precursor [Methylocystis sp.]|nr:MAG: outer-membrane immunogenic protein precursor [Methylocystis sp.]
MRKWILGVAALGLSSAQALAADMAFYRPPPRYIPPPVISWTGFYLGVNAGYSWGISPFITPAQDVTMRRIGPPVEARIAATAALGAAPRLRAPTDGFVGGLQVGFNWQAASGLVVGVEADAQGFGRVMSQATNSSLLDVPNGGGLQVGSIVNGMRSLDFLGTVRGRLGYLVTPTFMVYATGGLAYGSIRGNYGFTQALYVPPLAPFAAASWGGQSSFSTMRAGWTIGAGMEWMFYPGVTFKAEYMYYALGSSATPAFGFVDPTATRLPSAWQNVARAYTGFNGSLFRVGVNYLFNDPGPSPSVFGPMTSPVVARY